MKFLFSICFSIFLLNIYAQDIPVFTSFDDFEKEVLTIEDDKIYIINFWATWCGPCVKELPYFENLKTDYEGAQVVTILVSIDWATNLDKKLIPFISKHNLEKQVILFDDPKANDWINKIDPSWSGAIPITLFLSSDKKDFYEKEYHSTQEIETDLVSFLNK